MLRNVLPILPTIATIAQKLAYWHALILTLPLNQAECVSWSALTDFMRNQFLESASQPALKTQILRTIFTILPQIQTNALRFAR